MADIRVAETEAVAREVRALPGRALAIPTDVSVEEDVDRMVKEALREFGSIDILVNNAGTGFGTHPARCFVKDLKLKDWQAVIGTNLTGAFLCSRAVLGPMMEQKGGVIINISSGMGKAGRAGMAAYSADGP